MRIGRRPAYFGVSLNINHMADSYGMDPTPIADSCEAYVVYPIANTYAYEVDPMPDTLFADSHSYQSRVWSWSEPYLYVEYP